MAEPTHDTPRLLRAFATYQRERAALGLICSPTYVELLIEADAVEKTFRSTSGLHPDCVKWGCDGDHKYYYHDEVDGQLKGCEDL